MTEIRKRHWFGIHWAWVVLGSSFATLFINYSIRIGAYPVLLPKMIKRLSNDKSPSWNDQKRKQIERIHFFYDRII